MPSVEQLRNRLLQKLAELFQLDQPDLDFGFYRIMHAKAQEVQDFIDTGLLKIVSDAFGDVNEARKAELLAAYEKAIQSANDFGVPNPDETEPVKKAKAALDAVVNTASAEADVYDHLYRFFERYYDNGDFISRRYYTRETSGKAAPFAVPYNGEEVKLVWANMDQYYIKSTEYFNNFTFDLIQSAEVRKMSKEERVLNQIPDHPLKVHFRVVEATEGEHGNVKASEANKRFFILHTENPVALSETGELVVNFEYRPDPEKNRQDGIWRDKRNAEAVETILAVLKNHGWTLIDTDGKQEKNIRVNLCESVVQNYLRLLEMPAPTDSDKKRPVLAKYVSRYTARNTMDYFIHKDLGSFLRRELDFYIKNEVMRLDDIENAEAPAVESYLAKIKALRRIAGKLIDFLAQLEDFQKKLWLKKKFVVETNYCITLDRVPEDLYPEIAENQKQHEEWVNLGFVTTKNTKDTKKENTLFDDKQELTLSCLSCVSRLKENNKLVLDTRFFDDSFKARLLASVEDFDEQCDGLLIHSENFQALNLLQERYQQAVNGIYVDPPYNTATSEILYKNSYKHSSWLSMIHSRVIASHGLLRNDSGFCLTIDDFEVSRLKVILDEIFNVNNYLATVAIRNNPSGRSTLKGFSVNHEYALFYQKSNELSSVGRLPHSEKQLERYSLKDKIGFFEWENLRRNGPESNRDDRPKQYYPLKINRENLSISIPEMVWVEDSKKWQLKEIIDNNVFFTIFPIHPDGTEKVWRYSIDNIVNEPERFEAKWVSDRIEIYRKKYANIKGILPRTWWDNPKYSARDNGSRSLVNLFNDLQIFDFPKAPGAVMDSILVLDIQNNDIILDYFAGSGTTGHAVINLNREDEGQRKYILVEMGDYFDTVLKPRIAKVVYSENWREGKPVLTTKNTKDTKDEGDFSVFRGVSHCFKYLRLESYEDTLNNLRIDEKPGKSPLLNNSSLKEDYMLRYLLDVETRGSQSLLNIDAFADPTAYTLKVKKPGTDEYVTRAVDLIETFNYLIGLRVVHYAAPQEFTAQFIRIEDPEVPTDQKTKLVLDGKLQQIKENYGFTQIDTDKEENNPCSSVSICGSQIWWFRKVEGWVPKDPANPNNGLREKVLIV